MSKKESVLSPNTAGLGRCLAAVFVVVIMITSAVIPFISDGAEGSKAVQTQSASNDVGEEFYDKDSGLWYHIDSENPKTVSVVENPNEIRSYKGHITVPSSIVNEGNTYSVKKIDMVAFYECFSLLSVSISEGVEVIGRGAFSHCYNLLSIELPNSIKMIENSAFLGCTSITKLKIPDGLDTIESNAFGDCKMLNTIIVDSNSRFYTEDGVLFDRVDKKLVLAPAGRYIESYRVPDGIETIGSYSFGGCSSLKHIDFNGVKEIEGYAFYMCESLESSKSKPLDLSAVERIGGYAFGCCSFEKFVIPEKLEQSSNAFFYWTTIDEIESKSPLYKVIDGVLYTDFDGGRKIIISESGNKFDNGTFTVDSTIKLIDGSAFYKCMGLKEFKDGGSSSYHVSNDGVLYQGNGTSFINVFAYPAGKTDIEELTITSQMYIAIDNSAFVGNHTLKKVTFNGTTSHPLDSRPFADSSVEEVLFNIPSIYGSYDGAVYYVYGGKCDLWFCPPGKTSVATVYGDSSVICNGAFESCKYIEEVRLHNGINCIRQNVFNGCVSLEKINLPNDVITIGAKAFYGCSSLRTINTPSSLKVINNFAFANSGLSSFDFTDSISAIGYCAFADCKDLSEVRFGNLCKDMSVGEHVFSHYNEKTETYDDYLFIDKDGNSFYFNEESVKAGKFDGRTFEFVGTHFEEAKDSSLSGVGISFLVLLLVIAGLFLFFFAYRGRDRDE